MESLLSGVRIVELGHGLSGPFTTSLCADFGAEVIKVEAPGQGDPLRAAGPDRDGVHLWWKVAGRNKKSVTLDLQHPRGVALCLRLIAQADAVVETLGAQERQRLGLGDDSMRAVQPRLVIVSVSGPVGLAADGYSGVMHLTGEPDGAPLPIGLPVAETASGLMGACALAMALYHRDVHGAPPPTIDLRTHEAVARMIEWQVIVHDQLGIVPRRAGGKYPIGGGAVANTCRCADGRWLMVSGPASTMRKVLGPLGVEGDPRFATDEALYANVQAFDALMVAWIARQARDDALALLSRAGVTCAPVYDVADIVVDPQVRARGAIATVQDPQLGPVRMVGIVPTIPQAPGDIRWSGPVLGQHNDEVYGTQLGMRTDEIDALRREGVA